MPRGLNLFNRGLHTKRFKDNPEEERFALAWNGRNNKPGTPCGEFLLEYILGDGIKPCKVSARDREVAATVIQWLGSEIGQNFLEELGYNKDDVGEVR